MMINNLVLLKFYVEYKEFRYVYIIHSTTKLFVIDCKKIGV